MREEEESLKNYILGRLPEPEQIKIEERLLLDSDYVELLQIVEEELIDGYARGGLPERERKELEESLARSQVLQRKLTIARPFITRADKWSPPRKGSTKPAWQRWFGPLRSMMVETTLAPAWRLAFWAALLLAVGVVCWRVFLYQSLADKARIALQASFRESPIEGRIAGINWPPHLATLGGGSGASDEVSLDGAKALSHQAVADKGNPDSHHALGQVYLAIGDFDKAISELETAFESDPNNAEIRSDLGTAYLERGHAAQEKNRAKSTPEADSSLQDFNECLKHLNRALTLNPGLLAALFNIALCHEYMALLPQAQTDWREYLKHDSSSAWAVEARKHLQEIEEEEQKNSRSNDDVLQEFHAAYKSNNRQAAWTLVSGNREMITGRTVWWQLLGDFFDLIRSGKTSEASERLRELAYVGDLELSLGNEDGRQTGDRYVSELAGFYLSAPFTSVSVLREGHRWINEGNRRFGSSCDDALLSYMSARQIFEHEGDLWEVLLSDDLIGYCHIQKSELDRGSEIVSKLVTQCAGRGYSWLLARNQFDLAMIQDRRAEHSQALESTGKALQISESIEDSYDVQRSLGQLANQYGKLGNYESATTYISVCLGLMSTRYPGPRLMWLNLHETVQLLTARRLYAAAADYAVEALSVAQAAADARFTYVSYDDLAVLRAKLRDYPQAVRLAEMGLRAAPDLPESRAYSSLELGYVHRLGGELSVAMDEYDRCIRLIEAASRSEPADQPVPPQTANLIPELYGAHKGRLLCLIASGSDGAVKTELDATRELLERYRKNISEEENRNKFFDLEQSVYDAAIDFAYSRQADYERVFDYSEQSRARSLLDLIANAPKPVRLSEAKERLPHQTQLIEYAVLDDKVLISLISNSDSSVQQAVIRMDELSDKVSRFRRSILAAPRTAQGDEDLARIRSQAQDLYKLLIDPIHLSPQNGRAICFVPDKTLNSLPFGALVAPDTGRYLAEDFQITLAPSATVYLVCSENRNHTSQGGDERLLAVGNPDFDRSVFPDLPPLPATKAEVEDIATLYPSRSLVVLTGSNAEKASVKGRMVSADVIHVATHYKTYPGDPMSSGLVLARARTAAGSDNSDGFLQASEVYGINLRRAPVVVLSACDSGVESYYNGEGMIGMSRVFIAAGAPVVVASLWQVDARATGRLMVRFHQHRKVEGKPTAEALALAQRDMLTGALGDDYKHPYYWAGFTAIGGATTF